MAYNTLCQDNSTSCARIPYFSHPFVNYGGGPTGVLDENDNSLAHDLSAEVISTLESTLNTKILPTETISAGHFADAFSNIYVRNSSTYDIRSGASVTWRSGNWFVLQPGFRARPGSSFQTIFTTCTPIDVSNSNFSSSQNDKQSQTDIDEQHSAVYGLHAMPNPTKGNTTIDFSLLEAAVVTLEVYSQTGVKVATLLLNEDKPEGVYSISFDASGLSPGVYLCRLSTGKTTQTVQLEKLQ